MEDKGASEPQGPPPPYDTAVAGEVASSKPKAFEVLVTDPQKQGDGVGAYVSYKVRTRTTLTSFQRSEMEVVRRFRDFSWLADKLRERCKGVIIPPLPEKNAVQKYQMSAEFIESRRKALQVFINRVCVHQQLSDSEELRIFLEATEDVFAMDVARMNQEEGGAGTKLNKFLKGTLTTAQSFLQRGAEDEHEDPEYLKTREYLAHLESHLSKAHNQSARLIKTQNELGLSVLEFGQAAHRLGRYEQGKVEAAFTELAKHTGELSRHTKDSCKTLTEGFEAPMKEFTRMMKSVKAVINDRSTALAEYKAAKAAFESQKAKLSKLRGTPNAKQDKVLEAEREVESAECRMKDAHINYESIVDKMTAEVARFQKERAVEMSAVLRDFALAQAQLASQSAKEWGDLVAELQN